MDVEGGGGLRVSEDLWLALKWGVQGESEVHDGFGYVRGSYDVASAISRVAEATGDALSAFGLRCNLHLRSRLLYLLQGVSN